MPEKFNDIAAVVATRDYPIARAWYSRVIGRDPDLEPVDGVAEWQIATTAWLQLVEDPDRAGKSAVRIGVDDLSAQLAELDDFGHRRGRARGDRRSGQGRRHRRSRRQRSVLRRGTRYRIAAHRTPIGHGAAPGY